MKGRSLFATVHDQPAFLPQAPLMLVGLLLLAGCSGGGGEGSDQEGLSTPIDDTGSEVFEDSDSDAALVQLQGSWRTACLLTGGMLPYQRLIFNVTDTVFTFDVRYFVDSQCSDAGQETVSVGTLSEATSTQMNSERGVNVNVSRVTVTPLLSQVADRFNTMSFCGFANWVPEVSFDVSGCTDIEGLIAPRTEATVFLIDEGAMSDDPVDNVLFLGDLRGDQASVLNREVEYSRVR